MAMNPVVQSAIEATTKRHARLFAAYIGILIVTAFIAALFTWLVWDSGNKVQDAVQAEANARIEEARTASATANERAQKLENDNLKLRGDLNTEANQVSGLQRDAANAKAAQQRVETDLAKQQERAAIAERDLLALQDKIKPRHLSEEQKSSLVRLLSTETPLQGTLEIVSSMDAPDAVALRSDFEDVFHRLRWTVNGGNAIFSGHFTGIVIVVKDGNNAPPQAVAVLQALKAIGIEALGGIDIKVPDHMFEIRIGGKD